MIVQIIASTTHNLLGQVPKASKKGAETLGMTSNELIHKVSEVLTSVLITGESGTGKGVVARAIHDLGPRAKQPFVAFSASALPESLIEDELFGHEKGAFTGAIQSRRGRFEEARGGTIFLDENGDLALPLQAKLLRVLQRRSLERLGSNALLPSTSIICATSRNLEKWCRKAPREDLYFRISVVRIHSQPARENGRHSAGRVLPEHLPKL
jgi:transcriptional regulator with GAF, ATPase, and Fis domain